ncbi:MAG: peptidylprolyl isomerase [Cyanobacteria bacterium P01_A01_bin.135]
MAIYRSPYRSPQGGLTHLPKSAQQESAQQESGQWGMQLAQPLAQWLGYWLGAVALMVAVCGVSEGAIAAELPGISLGLAAPPTLAALPPGDAITDGKALLRYALPIENKPIREVQRQIEDISERLRIQGTRALKGVRRNVKRASYAMRSPEKILADVPPAKELEAKRLLEQVRTGLADLDTYIEERDKEAVWIKRGEMLKQIGKIEEMMVTEAPFVVPDDYSNLPQLAGRATVEMVTDKGSMLITVDGYNAPVTAGNFVDLVQRGFYDGLPVTREEEFYVVQMGDPDGPDDGFVDPDTGKVRTVPMEIAIQDDDEPVYGMTLEQAGLYLADPVLPFSAYGTLAMARPDSDPNGGSSQFFFLRFESELTPAGINLLDGRYAVFGYVVENEEVLDRLRVGDRIQSMTVVEGGENLRQPSAA